MNTIKPPTPEDILAAVKQAGLTRAEAAGLVHASLDGWHCWCAPVNNVKHRQMPLAAWELLLLKTNSHPSKKLVDR